MAQSTSDRDVALRREQIMQARRLWENTASEEALGELFAPFLQRVEPACTAVVRYPNNNLYLYDHKFCTLAILFIFNYPFVKSKTNGRSCNVVEFTAL